MSECKYSNCARTSYQRGLCTDHIMLATSVEKRGVESVMAEIMLVMEHRRAKVKG